MASTTSIRLVFTPVDQLDTLAANPLNDFTATAEKVKFYVETGSQIASAIEALFAFYDTQLGGKLSIWGKDNDKTDIQNSIRSVLETLRHAHLGCGATAYEVTDVDVRFELNGLGNTIKAKICASLAQESFFFKNAL